MNGRAVTLRTSIIGHQLTGTHGLLEWFLSNKKQVTGYTNAVFSGLPTVELAKVIHENVLAQPSLNGLYHVGAAPISKFTLLQNVASAYGLDCKIKPCDGFRVDRSLNSSKCKRIGNTP